MENEYLHEDFSAVNVGATIGRLENTFCESVSVFGEYDRLYHAGGESPPLHPESNDCAKRSFTGT